MCEKCEKYLGSLFSEKPDEVDVKTFNMNDIPEEVFGILFKALALKMATALPEEGVKTLLGTALIQTLIVNAQDTDDINKFETMVASIKDFSEKTIKVLEKDRAMFETFMAEIEAARAEKH